MPDPLPACCRRCRRRARVLGGRACRAVPPRAGAGVRRPRRRCWPSAAGAAAAAGPEVRQRQAGGAIAGRRHGPAGPPARGGRGHLGAHVDRRRRRHRGYDQAEVLARAVAWRLGVPCRRPAPAGGRRRPPQTGRSRPSASTGPAFVARRRVRRRGAGRRRRRHHRRHAAGGRGRAPAAPGPRAVHCLAAAATP